MLFKLKNKIVIEKLIKKLKLSCKLYVDKNHIINNISSIKYSNSNSLSFIEGNDVNKYKYKKGVIISSKIYPFFKNQIITKNPRFLFCKIVDLFFLNQLQAKNYPLKNFREFYLKKRNKEIFISKNSFIGENVSIGKKTYIGNNVVIYPGTKIGNNVIIFDNTVLGVYGLGYTRNKLMPHLGNLIIKDNVKIGANCTIVRGTLENTSIGQNVKIGNNVNISHNVKIFKNSIIASSSVIAGGVKIKSGCQISGGVSVKNNVTIGKNSRIAIGSVVVKDINKCNAVFGNPAKKIILLKKLF